MYAQILMIFLNLQLFLFALAKSEITVPSSITVKHNGVVITSFETMVFTDIGRITLSCDDKNIEWSIFPDLPKSLFWSGSLITGIVTESLETTIFTITATNESGSVTILFPITITDCEDGIILYPTARNNDNGRFKVRKNGETKYDIHFGGSINPVCIAIDNYDYEISCMRYDHFCSLLLEDKDNNVYFAALVYAGYTNTGSFSLEVTSAPTPVTQYNPMIQRIDRETAIFFSATTMYNGNLTFTPALPSTIQYDRISSALIGTWTEQKIYTFTVECSNSFGTGTLEFTIAVNTCLDPSQSLTRWYCDERQSILSFNLTNSNKEVISHYSSSDYLDLFLCFKPDHYILDVEMDNVLSEDDLKALVIYDDTDHVIWSFNEPYDYQQYYHGSYHINLLYTVPGYSTLRFTKDSVDSKWTDLEYEESGWKDGSFDQWGLFDVDRVYFRKRFTFADNYAHIIVDIFGKDKVTVYVNRVLLFVLDQLKSNGYTHVSIPSSAVVQGDNIIAVMVERANSQISSPIVFDLRIRPLYSSCISYILNGVSSDDLQEPDIYHPASNAFDNKIATFWKGTALPATLFYSFNNNQYEMINQVEIFTSNRDYAPTAFSVVGITGNEKIVLLDVHSTTLFAETGWYTMSFSNKQAFNQYGIIFYASKSGNQLLIDEIRLSSCNELFCKERTGYSPIPTGDVYYEKCPVGSSGTFQVKCIDIDNKPEWFDDMSSCLPIHPPKGISYIDMSFSLFNVSILSWKKEVKNEIRSIISEYLRILPNNTDFTFVRDLSTNTSLHLYFSLRLTLDEHLGQFVITLAQNLIQDVNRIVAERLGSRYTGISSQVEGTPALFMPINWMRIISYCLLVLLICVLCIVLYSQLRKKRKNSSLLSI